LFPLFFSEAPPAIPAAGHQPMQELLARRPWTWTPTPGRATTAPSSIAASSRPARSARYRDKNPRLENSTIYSSSLDEPFEIPV